MKIKLIYDELLAIITKAGVNVRKDLLVKSRGGFCMLNENKLIILNKILPIEVHASILARCISDLNLIEDTFITPVIRSYIETETASHNKIKSVEFVIEERKEESI